MCVGVCVCVVFQRSEPLYKAAQQHCSEIPEDEGNEEEEEEGK